MRLGDHRIDPPLVLAPMASITNPPFRQLCLELGAGLACSEMISAYQLGMTDKPSLIERCPKERVLVVQLYGRSPKLMAHSAKIAMRHGADVLDINMGCPARKVVKQGAGVALMREPELAVMMTRAVSEAVSIPVTVKMRSGFSVKHQNAPELAKAVVEAGARGVAVHCRTREAVHTGPFDWEVIRKVRDALPPDVPVVGNGGVTSPSDAEAMRAQTGCDGVMIGRAACGNPWIFSGRRDDEDRRPANAELRRVVLRHLELYVRWGGEGRAVLEMRKHLRWYLRGFPGAAKLRHALGGLAQAADIVELVEDALTEN